MTPGEKACGDLSVSLKEHFQTLVDGLEKRVTVAQTTSQEAIAKAEKAMERRLDLLNEFRSQAADESKKYVTKDTQVSTDKRLNDLSSQISRLYGGVLVVGLIGVVNIVKLWLHT